MTFVVLRREEGEREGEGGTETAVKCANEGGSGRKIDGGEGGAASVPCLPASSLPSDTLFPEKEHSAS